jgi:GNAT superfamily N-acetyltransferase
MFQNSHHQSQQHQHGKLSCHCWHPESNKFIALAPPAFIQKHKLQICTFSVETKTHKLDNICLFYQKQSSSITYTEGYERSTIYITDVFVAENVRRQSLGTYFLYLVACEARKKRFHTISLDSVLDAHNLFYERLGFKYLQGSGDNEMAIKTMDLIHNIEKLQ